jgi:ABC-type nitrate/sulfonate/bicarbonate transport system ATPase subunit
MVVGRAGHGKSAFVRMIASATEKARISEAMESKETDCRIYKSDKFADIFGGD